MARILLRALGATAVIGLTAASAVASDDRNKNSAGISGFDWFANAAQPAANAEAIARTRAAILKARGLNKGATWVCSPAGSGKKAACHKS